ncbi:MAG: NADPH:quinone oxidoreductase family protein [Paracoccus sp. (in: a-proteobacteria)]|nr:NADPH:quinone oxidoreductase family protein [Paracoccus sp. (in: a-proteobacteria)]
MGLIYMTSELPHRTVRTALVEARGALPVLRESALAQPGAGQVLVAMKAAALNFADLLMVSGSYQDTPPYPFVPGMEGAGEVIAAGPGCTLREGARVAVGAMGCLTEAGLFDESACQPIPDAMSFDQAAGFQIAYGSSHLALDLRARLRAGETLAVLGAAGGVGLTAVEIGAAMGARVIAVARGADKLDVARKAGAAELIDSDETGDLRAALRQAGPVDVVYDPVGGAAGLAAFGALRPGGRFLVVGFAGGAPPDLPLNHALVKNIAIHGFYWAGYHRLDPAALRASMETLLAMFEEGKLRPHIGAAMPLSDLQTAYEALRARKIAGKLIVRTAPEAP